MNHSAEMTACPHCGEYFGCGSVARPVAKACWCAELPVLQGVDQQTAALRGCYCPACLQALLAQQDIQPQPCAGGGGAASSS